MESNQQEVCQHYNNIQKFIDNIKVQKRINPAHHLFKIANLFEYYDDSDCILAMDEAISLNVYSYSIIKGYITHQTKPKTEQLNLFNIELPQEIRIKNPRLKLLFL